MIRSESEYKEARECLQEQQANARKEREALATHGLLDEEIERAMQPVISFQAQLAEEIAWYEKVSRGDVGPISSLTQLGRTLIALRIANGWTQRELADRLRVSEAQVSRDERNEYHGITVERAQRILEALGARFQGSVQGESLLHKKELTFA